MKNRLSGWLKWRRGRGGGVEVGTGRLIGLVVDE